MKNTDNSQKNSLDTFKTTIGDLIEAITDIALEAGKTEKEGYHLASLTLEKILNRKLESAKDIESSH